MLRLLLLPNRDKNFDIYFNLLLMCGLFFVIHIYLFATPPYGDPNQPYDRLPGTWKTYHVKWLKPLSEGRLKVLFIIPFSSSREVVELAQRLDLDYTVIMNAGRSSWARGGGGGGGAAPTTLMGVEADAVLEEIASQRLNLLFRYDVIVIGKVSWEVIPKKYRTLILKHVERGTGLTYVSPNRLKHVTDGDKEYAKEQKNYNTNITDQQWQYLQRPIYKEHIYADEIND